MTRVYKDKPPRLNQLYATYKSPLYFVTFCSFERRPILACEELDAAFRRFAGQAEGRGIAIGRYVIMPDHIHLFIAPGLEGDLSMSMQLMKRALSVALKKMGNSSPHWQPGFHDRLLRRSDSYSEKWEYVRNNPVRAKLVVEPDQWPFQGEIVPIQW
jgi:putative transposase